MNFLKKLFLGVILNSLAILFCQKLLNGLLNDFYFQGTLVELILLALALSFLNLSIKPIIHFIFLPLIWITLGLFVFIINIIILKIATLFIPSLIIQFPVTWLVASIIISVFNSLIYKMK